VIAGETVVVRASSCTDNGRGICTSCSTVHPIGQKAITLGDLTTQIASLGPGIDRMIAERKAAEQKLHNAETALLLVRATTTDEKTRAIAEAALELLHGGV